MSSLTPEALASPAPPTLRQLFALRGVSIPDGCRFAQFDHLFSGLTLPVFRESLSQVEAEAIFAHAFQDNSIARIILAFDPPERTRSQWKALLCDSYRDAAFPPPYFGGETPGRDAQHHLLVAALLGKAGWLLDAHAEPDVLLNFENQRWGVACKRVKSLRTLADRVNEAIDQILKAGLPGVVFVDITPIANPLPQLCCSDPRDWNFKKTAMHTVMGYWNAANIRIPKTSWIRGIGVFMHIAGLSTDGTPQQTSVLFSIINAANTARRRECERFFDGFRAALPGIASLSPIPAGTLHNEIEFAVRQERRTKRQEWWQTVNKEQLSANIPAHPAITVTKDEKRGPAPTGSPP